MSQSEILLQKLEKANGRTEHIVALIFDVRGFTDFCKEEGDSVNIANFVRRIYIQSVEKYFPNATYYKPTGDGMLIIFKCEHGEEVEKTKSIVEKAFNMCENFDKFCQNDPLIYFSTPAKIGIGLARGSACCIYSDEEIIDYSGKPINLASRLCNMARPTGVVFDKSIMSCLTKNPEMQFQEDKVFVKGLSDSNPMPVYSTKITVIPKTFKCGSEPIWKTAGPRTTSISKLVNLTGLLYTMTLPEKPIDITKVVAKVSFKVSGDAIGFNEYTINDNIDKNVYFEQVAGESQIVFNKKYLISRLRKRKVSDDAEIKIEIKYPV